MDLFNLGPKFSIFNCKLDKWLMCPTCDQTFPFVVVNLTKKLEKFGHNLDKGHV
jgi:hypothetical protein